MNYRITISPELWDQDPIVVNNWKRPRLLVFVEYTDLDIGIVPDRFPMYCRGFIEISPIQVAHAWPGLGVGV